MPAKKNNNKDSQILSLINTVKEKRKEIENAGKHSFKTNGLFSYSDEVNSNSSKLNINVLDLNRLLNVRTFLYVMNNQHQLLNPGVDFTWCNYTFSDWVLDLNSRIMNVTIDKKKKELKILEERLDKIISPELRAEMELESLQREINEKF